MVLVGQLYIHIPNGKWRNETMVVVALFLKSEVERWWFNVGARKA